MTVYLRKWKGQASILGFVAVLCLATLSITAVARFDVIQAKTGQEVAKSSEQEPVGYTDTPFLPGGKWRVHDPNRPHPRVVNPGSAWIADKPGIAPSDAVILFDGGDLSSKSSGTARSMWNGRLPGRSKATARDGETVASSL